MSGEDYAAKIALLRAQLEAAKLDGADRESLADLAREPFELGLAHGDAAAVRGAIAELENALDRREPSDEMLLHYYGARAALATNDGVGAVREAERAVALAREHELEEDLPHLLVELADGLERASRPADAKRAREEAATLLESMGEFTRAGMIVAQTAQGAPFDEAPALFRRALDLTERGGDGQAVGMVLFSLGCWHQERDEYLPSKHALERALKIAEDESEPEALAYCLSHLAWLEVEAFRHREAIERATQAHDRACDDWQRGRALDARANARHRLHDHLGARADLLAASRAFEASGDSEWAKDCQRRADGDRLLHYLHYLPSWVFRHRDMTTRESAFRRQFQPFWLWFLGTFFVWFVGLSVLGLEYRSKVVLFLAVLPIVVAFGASTFLLGSLLLQRLRAKREG